MSHPARKSSPTRRDLVNIRMSREDRNVIDRAARVAGKTRTEFMIEAARRAAHDTLLDTNLVLVDGRTFARFKELFDTPPQANERLLELIDLESPWDS